ncbi:CD276 antigen-like isoform X2 [Ptychodera flava]|uniref:CD276 antigen-like isoform X2 n=1 Tax=Ptychodera flava TaxID=63121 RepID=UPI00396A4873
MPRLLVIFLLSTVVHTAYGLSVTTDALHEALQDETVTLKCQFSPPSGGGNQYAITWKFSGEYASTSNEIIYVHEGSGSSTAYGQFAGRATVSGSRGDLRISKVKLTDVGDFVCEVNYYVINDQGSASTRLEVYAVVQRVDILEYYTGSYVYVKPGRTLDLTCKSYRGRPQAKLMWYFDNQLISGGSESVVDNRDGTYDTTSTYRYVSKREDHNKILKCQSDQSPRIQYRFEYDQIFINTAGASTTTVSIVAFILSFLVIAVQKL